MPQRVTGARRRYDEDALVEEGKSWDFLLAQMADWKERERSWDGFRKEVERKREKGKGGVLGLGLGLRLGRCRGVGKEGK